VVLVGDQSGELLHDALDVGDTPRFQLHAHARQLHRTHPGQSATDHIVVTSQPTGARGVVCRVVSCRVVSCRVVSYLLWEAWGAAGAEVEAPSSWKGAMSASTWRSSCWALTTVLVKKALLCCLRKSVDAVDTNSSCATSPTAAMSIRLRRLSS